MAIFGHKKFLNVNNIKYIEKYIYLFINFSYMILVILI